MKPYLKTNCSFTRNCPLRLAPTLVVVIVLAISAQLSAQDQHGYTIIEFNTPGFQDTLPEDINPEGSIVGKARNAIGAGPAFMRAPNGTITTFEAPGSVLITAFSTNPAGAITGAYQDASGVFHGFLRAPGGAITEFDAPGAGTVPGTGTSAQNINAAGTIAGRTFDNNSVQHGFVRARDGTITTYDGPGAGTGFDQGTFPAIQDGINSAGAITGSIWDASDVFHGFVRAHDGAITAFDAPGAGTGAFQGTLPGGINDAGTIDGSYSDASDVNHGFVRAPDGTITTFDVPGAGTGAFQGTIPANINNAGAIDGSYVDTAMWLTASCGLPTAASRRSTLLARAQDSARARFPKASTSRARSRDTTLTITT